VRLLTVVAVILGVSLAPAAVVGGWWPVLVVALWAALFLTILVGKRRRDQQK
jgi:lipopolysaccharide export LptBFGC system permease protein LptF